MILNSFTIKKPFIDTTPDVIVIGSGAGGSACAARLQSAGKKVYLLEEGWNHPYTAHGKDEAFALSTFYRNSGLLTAVGTPPIPVLMGRTLGGSARVNQACALRMPQKVRLRWKKAGIDWVDEIDDYYTEVEKEMGVSPISEYMLNKNGEVFIRAVKACGGEPELMRRNAPGCDGCGVCVTGCPTLKKKSPDLAFVLPASEMGLTVICGARAMRVKERTDGVEVEGTFLTPEGKKISYFHLRSKFVVISCGAIYTPLLLHRSGIPDPHRRIGKNLHLHPTILVYGVHAEKIDGFVGIPMQAHTFSFFQEHECALESMFLMPLLAMVGMPGAPYELYSLFTKYRYLSMAIIQRMDSSPGQVSFYGEFPYIEYYLTLSDEEHMKEVFFTFAGGLLDAGAEKVILQAGGNQVFTSKKQLRKKSIRLRGHGAFVYSAHPQGSCSAGDDPERYPVRPDLSLRPGERIFVADTSVFPYPTGVNPVLTATVTGMKAADEILNRL